MAVAVILQAPDRVPTTVAQQMFVIGSGLAGGVAGFYLARELADVEDVPVPLVTLTTLISILFTVGAGVYLARKAKGR